MAKKLFVSFAITVALICVIGVTSVVSVNGLNNHYSSAIDNHAMPLNQAISVVGAMRAAHAGTMACIVYTGNKEEVLHTRKEIDRSFKEFEDSASAFGRFIVRPEVKALYDEAMKVYSNVFKWGVYKIAEDAETGVSQAEMIEYMDKVTKPALELVTDNILKAADIKADQLSVDEARGNAQAQTVLVTMMILIIVSIGVSGVVHFIIFQAVKSVDGGVGKR
jgi:hypothetical protein